MKYVKRELPDVCGTGLAEATAAMAAQRREVEKRIFTELKKSLYEREGELRLIQ